MRMTRHSTRRVRIYSALSLMLSEVFPLINWQQIFLPKMDAYTCLWSAHFRASNDDLLFNPACNSNLSLTSHSFLSVNNILHALHGINFRTWEKRRLQLCFRYLCWTRGTWLIVCGHNDLISSDIFYCLIKASASDLAEPRLITAWCSDEPSCGNWTHPFVNRLRWWRWKSVLFCIRVILYPNAELKPYVSESSCPKGSISETLITRPPWPRIPTPGPYIIHFALNTILRRNTYL